ncbi:MAG: hypothetical protein NVSMB64_19440 [Candidatus Velthaea sp.]
MKSSSAARSADRRKPIVFVTIGVLAVALIVFVALANNGVVPGVPKAATEVRQQAKLKVGQAAPPFSVSTTAGPFDLATAQTPVFLEVFATWCPHCQREVPVVDALAKKYGKQMTFVAVSGSGVGIDGNTPESQADVIAFGQKYGVTYPVAYDPDLKVANAYLQSGFPTIVLIKKDKTISSLQDGEISSAALESAIKAAL